MFRKPDAEVKPVAAIQDTISKIELIPQVLTEIEQLKSDIAEGVDVKNREITFQNILFNFNSDEILTESETDLKAALDLLNDVKDLKVTIDGHTSAEGTDKYNLDLSRKRANAVKNYLVSNGIDATRLKTEGKGKSEPIAPNDSEENKQLNRRIVFNVNTD